MHRRILFTLCLLLIAAIPSRQATTQTKPFVPVVLISIDGLKPDYVLEADKHKLKIPNLRRLTSEGAHASGVVAAFPTVTYPNHTTMVTGVSPSKHGILANTPFDPFGKNQGGWYWYAEDIRVPTLWDAASQAGLVTASVDWPVTVGANITHNIAQYWRAETPDDLKLIRALSTPGLLSEAERHVGSYPRGNDYTVAADHRRAAFTAFVLEKKKPNFLLCYFSGLDTEEHSSGPYSRETFSTLEQIDEMVGQVRAAAEKLGDGRAVICVVSDHGFMRIEKEININAALSRAGLIKLDSKGRVESWRAISWYAGGSAAIMLENSRDDEARSQVGKLLKQLASDPQNGIDRVIEGPEINKLDGFPGAAFALSAREGFKIGRNLDGPLITPCKDRGMHGYLPDIKAMHAAFFISGPGIPEGLDLGVIDMRDLAPTLAALMGLALPLAEGRDLFRDRK